MSRMVGWEKLPRFWIEMKHGLTMMRKKNGFAGASDLAASLYLSVWGQGLSMILSYDEDQPLMELRAEKHHKEGGDAPLLQGSVANIVYMATVAQPGYSERDKEGYIYLAESDKKECDGLTKIGYTRQLPKYRADVLKVEILGELEVEYPEAAEAWYHTRFSLHRNPLAGKFDGSTEWFKLTGPQIDNILSGLVAPPEVG
ncbi:hypothetical protein LCGC14_2669940 [marine sediment metagenome]|uniref:Bacteriophage T5 Orf172 DNA-binding domain-containing protein n=1 Tax=marine sediment metagenome TaxID=412755 RepID=A0A0F8ZPF5_9ZZZZ